MTVNSTMVTIESLTINEKIYLEMILQRIRVCKAYKPRFGTRGSVSASQFESLYGNDPFYAWFGLNDPLIYAAHKAAGGITSLYRQIGIGCEQVFRQLLQDQFGLNATQSEWSYIIGRGARARSLHLDGRIEIQDLKKPGDAKRCTDWLAKASKEAGTDPRIVKALKGIVFEIRQGYKSKDSKRQNADIANAGKAYAQGYLPVAIVLSSQIDADIVDRYQAAGWLLLRGTLDASTVASTYAFFREIVSFDLGAFFEKVSGLIKDEVKNVLQEILSPQS